MKLDAFHSIRIALGGALCVLLLTTCDSPIQRNEVDPAAQFAEGGGGGEEGGEDPPPAGVWDGTQEIVFNESFSGGDRLVVVAGNGSNRAVVFTRLDGDPSPGDAEIAPDGNSIVFHYDAGVYRISRDLVTSDISPPVLLFDFDFPTSQPEQTVSPDGTRVAWTGIDPDFIGCGPALASIDLYVHDLAAGTSTRITSNNNCLTEPTITTKTPVWVSNTEIAVSQRNYGNNNGNDYIEAWDIGTLEDVDDDGVIDILVVTTNTHGYPPPVIQYWVPLEWAPDAARGVIVTPSPWDLYLVDFSGSTNVSCNITSAIDNAVFEPSLGPGNRIVFRIRTGKKWSLVTGTVGPGCPASVVLDEPFVTQGSGRGAATPTNPHWRRPM